MRAEPRVSWTRDVLRYCDQDANGHVNNSVFSVFCESGRVHHLNEVLKARGTPGIFFVIARLAIDFRAELHYPGEVEVGTWLPSIGRSSIAYRQVILDQTGRLVANSDATVVQMDAATRRPAPFCDALRARLEPLVLA